MIGGALLLVVAALMIAPSKLDKRRRGPQVQAQAAGSSGATWRREERYHSSTQFGR